MNNGKPPDMPISKPTPASLSKKQMDASLPSICHVHNIRTRKILQLFPNPIGWTVVFRSEDGDSYEPIVFWALVEEYSNDKNCACCAQIVAPMVIGDDGALDLILDIDNPKVIVPPGTKALWNDIEESYTLSTDVDIN